MMTLKTSDSPRDPPDAVRIADIADDRFRRARCPSG